MHQTLVVEVKDADHNLEGVLPNIFFSDVLVGRFLSLDQLGKVPFFSILHNYIQMLLLQKRGIILDYMRVIQFTQVLHLLKCLKLTLVITLIQANFFHDTSIE